MLGYHAEFVSFYPKEEKSMLFTENDLPPLEPAYLVSVYFQALSGQAGSSMELSAVWWEVVGEFELAGFVQEHLRISLNIFSSYTISCPVQSS